jgi:hypothetical protein
MAAVRAQLQPGTCRMLIPPLQRHFVHCQSREHFRQCRHPSANSKEEPKTSRFEWATCFISGLVSRVTWRDFRDILPGNWREITSFRQRALPSELLVLPNPGSSAALNSRYWQCSNPFLTHIRSVCLYKGIFCVTFTSSRRRHGRKLLRNPEIPC